MDRVVPENSSPDMAIRRVVTTCGSCGSPLGKKKTITLTADGSDVDDGSASVVLVDSLVVVAAADRIDSLHLPPRPDETGQIRSTSECGES